MSNGSAPRVVLLVLDGWGYRPEREGNAIALASTPNWQRLWRSYPRTLLQASGLAVGLPEGQMGNSEVGHLNLGAGRIVPQELVRISQSIQTGEFYRLEPLVNLCSGLRQSGGTLHLVGLLGPGGVHALDRHLLACVELGVRERVEKIAIHGFLDGRDSAPTLGAEVVRTLLLDMRRIAGSKVDVATLTGRYYGMDRDRRWDRTRLAYDAMVYGIGIPIDRQTEIFDPFVQLNRGLTQTTEGTGLGLSISRDLARGMGGDLRVHSIDRMGSTFSFVLRGTGAASS